MSFCGRHDVVRATQLAPNDPLDHSGWLRPAIHKVLPASEAFQALGAGIDISRLDKSSFGSHIKRDCGNAMSVTAFQHPSAAAPIAMLGTLEVAPPLPLLKAVLPSEPILA